MSFRKGTYFYTEFPVIASKLPLFNIFIYNNLKDVYNSLKQAYEESLEVLVSKIDDSI